MQRRFCVLAGINTGTCITGDADCDGDPGNTGDALTYDGGDDDPVLDRGEYVVLLLNFAANNTLSLNSSMLQKNVIVVGVPASLSVGVEYLDTFRAARHLGTAPRNGFGTVISGGCLSPPFESCDL